LLQPMDNWTKNVQTQAEVEVFILDRLYESLPRPPYTNAETEAAAKKIYNYVWQRSASGKSFGESLAA